MVDTPTTYENLFDLLVSLGFRDSSGDDAVAAEPRAFIHERTDTVLLFRNTPADSVSPADILSTEVHLQGKGIAEQPLESLMSAIASSK